jgi:hypothetical protein
MNKQRNEKKLLKLECIILKYKKIYVISNQKWWMLKDKIHMIIIERDHSKHKKNTEITTQILVQIVNY